MCEIALVSSKRSRLQQAERNGSNGARIALQLLSEPEKFLSTIQIGITIVGIVSGAYGANAFAEDLEPVIAKWEPVAPYSHAISMVLIVSVISYFSLIIGELVPKTIALNNPEKITIAFAPFMRMLAILTHPLVVSLSYSTKMVLKLLFIKRNNDPPVTEDELKYLIDTGAKQGTIKKEEGILLHSVFRFGDQKAKHLMTLRRDIQWLNADQAKEDILKDIFRLTYTKYPVCEGTLDKVIGVVSVTDVLRYIHQPDFNIRDYLKAPIYFPDSIPALRILEEFRLKKNHIGFVLNEQGVVSGLVTLHDLVENIVGELPGSDRDPYLRQREDGSWLASGRISINSLCEQLGITQDPRAAHHTLETFIISNAGKHVEVGSTVIFSECKFEVMDMDGEKIDKVLITINKDTQD